MISQNKDRLLPQKGFLPVNIPTLQDALKMYDEFELIVGETMLRGTFVNLAGIFTGFSGDNSKIYIKDKDGEIHHLDEKNFKRHHFRTANKIT